MMAAQEEFEMPPMTKEMKLRVKALTRLQNAHETITEDYEREMRELERKYHKLYQPLYDTRAAIVSGAQEATGKEGETDTEEEEEESDNEDDEGAVGAKGVPGFWLRALANCRETAEMIQEQDLPILEHLVDIKLTYLDNTTPGYSLEFVFAPNPFFNGTSLIKTYKAQDVDGDVDVVEGQPFEIQWKEGKDPTHIVIKKKQKNKKTGQVRMVTKKEKRDSFFDFFSPPAMPNLEELEGAEDLPEGFQELAERAQMDLEMGDAIKEKIIPEAVLYFLGIAEEDEDDFDDGDEDDEDDEDDEEDSDDEA